MDSKLTKIAAALAFIIGAMSIFAGGLVVLGKTMDYYVIAWLPIFNLTVGLFSVFFAAVVIWRNSKIAFPVAIAIFASNVTVLLVLQIAYRDVVAPDSIRAMMFRIVVWLIILSLMIVQTRKNGRAPRKLDMESDV